MLDIRSIFMPKKRNKSLVPDPAQQDLGSLRQGSLPQQQDMVNPGNTFQKRLKQNSPVSLSAMFTAKRKGSQPKGFTPMGGAF